MSKKVPMRRQKLNKPCGATPELEASMWIIDFYVEMSKMSSLHEGEKKLRNYSRLKLRRVRNATHNPGLDRLRKDITRTTDAM